MKDYASASYLQSIMSTVIYYYYFYNHTCFVLLPLSNTIFFMSQYSSHDLIIQHTVILVGCIENYQQNSKPKCHYLTLLVSFCHLFTGLIFKYEVNFFIAYVIIISKYFCLLLLSIFLGSFAVICHVVSFILMIQNGVI